MKRLGRQTVFLPSTPVIISQASVGGKMEGEGPLARYFDQISTDAHFGSKSWEKAENAMLKTCFGLALSKGGLTLEDIDYLFTGDLLNQCTASAFAARDCGIPFFGLYGACSTMAESLSLGAMLVEGDLAERVCAMTSSHFCTAERQFRMPLPYGAQRTPTAQRTATAAGAIILGRTGEGPRITHITTGKLVDGGITDSANMGAAMAPAALETLCTHFSETGRSPEYYDLIVTGDLGRIGRSILDELALEHGFNLKTTSFDCGMAIYDASGQDVHAGGSGCGCAASVLAGYLVPRLLKGDLKRILFAATGAIMSPVTAMQGESILGICHALSIENEV